jgi:catalase
MQTDNEYRPDFSGGIPAARKRYLTIAGILFRLLTPAQRRSLYRRTARSLGGAPRATRLRHAGNCGKADPAFGLGVAAALGLPASRPWR